MASRNASLALLALLTGTVGYAWLHTDAEEASPSSRAPARVEDERVPGTAPGLPPGHPALGESAGGSAASLDPRARAIAPPTASGDEPGLTWRVPPTWTTAPNPSSMRIATYRVPRAPGDADDADVSVVRAGGATDANIERWIGQFESHQPAKRATFTGSPSGANSPLTITLVDVTGTLSGGGMMTPGASAPAHPNWTILGAIVEGLGTPYFVKITGPAATVHAARPGLDALLASLRPG